MAITRLERKGRKNKNVAKKRVSEIKRLQIKPVIKNIDIEVIKAEFEKQGKPKSVKKETNQESNPVEEVKPVVVEKDVVKEPKEEKKEESKPVAKKKAPKTSPKKKDKPA